MGYIFRAYHAMVRQRPMSTHSGLPTAAVYVFVNMLRKLRADFSPQYLAAVFDLSGPTFRDEQAKAITSVRKFDIKTRTFQETQYLGYKANRAAMPPDLAQQVPYIRRALEAYRIPILAHEGFEADDVIGTLARQAAEREHSVFIVSSDKDMMQLVNDKVSVLNPMKDNLISDPAKVEELLGVKPGQVVDVMALRGDSIDNIPGAPGIGDKGSVDLIQRFGSVEQAIERAAEVERKSYRESLQVNRENIIRSKGLVTIDCHVPVEMDLDVMRIQEPNLDELRALFKELEFNTLLKELVSETSTEFGETRLLEVTPASQIQKILKAAKKSGMALAVDSVTPAIQPAASGEDESGESGDDAGEMQLPLMQGVATPEVQALVASDNSAGSIARPAHQIAISTEAGSAAVITPQSSARQAVAAALEDENIPKAVHDYKSVAHALQASGIALAGVRHDTMLYSYLLNPTWSNHSLKEVALRKFNVNLSDSPAQAADVTGRLASVLSAEVKEEGLTGLYNEIDLPLVPVLARMEIAGVKIDCDVLKEMSSRLEIECAGKARQIHELAGMEFNINSPKQLGDVLFNKMNLPKPLKYGKGKTISTAVDVLEELAQHHEVPQLVLDYRRLSKLKSTYVDALPVLLNSCTQRLHTTFNAATTATGRLSSTNPNLQNIPIRTELGREIRAAFIAEPGFVLLAADYSQIELRLLAHYSEDKLLTEAYRRGDDIHTLTASEVFGIPPMMLDAEHRRRAKAVNFGIVYGLSAFGLAQQLGIEPREAKKFIEAYFEKYQGVRTFIDRTLEETRREQKVRTLLGRVRPIPDINSRNANMRGFAERTAVNSPLQGTAADLIKLAMIRIDQQILTRRLKSRMTLQVHDELVFEAPVAEVEEMRELVRQQMEEVYPLRVPLRVEIGVGKNWRDLE